MREPMDEVTNPDVETVVLQKSSQVGGTELLLNAMGYFMHQEPAPMLLIEPTLDIAEAYSKDRLAPMLRDTPALAALMPTSKTRSSDITILHKKFPGGHATLGGSNSPAGLASRPIRILLMDEVDRYAASAGAEGDATVLAGKRTTTFWNRKKLYVSSPGVKMLSKIEPAFLASDRRYYHVPCHRCAKFQKLTWGQVRWDKGRPDTAHYVCVHCGGRWNDAQRWQAILDGKWIAEAPFAGVAGFHLWEGYSPWVRLAEIATAHQAAYEKLQHGDPEAMKAFVNTTLGETWTESGERPDSDPLLARRENYDLRTGVPWRALYLTAGVDVQDDRIEVEIIAWRADKRFQPEESWGVEVLIIHGDPAQPQIWTDLDEILLRTWRTEDGRYLRLGAVAIDSGGHHTEMVYKFCNPRSARSVWAVKGRAGALPIWPPRSGKSRAHKGSRVYIVGVDTAKDTVYSRLRIKEEGPGYCHFPMAYDGDFFRQLTCEQVQTKFVRGFPVREWHKPQGVRNEALDRRAYALAALYSRQVPWEILVRNAPTEPPGSAPPEDKPPPPAGPPPPRPAARPVRMTSRR